MSKTKKIKAIVLLIIFAFSIILIVTGASMNDGNDEGSPNSSTTVYAYEFANVYAERDNHVIEFSPNSSGYYNIYIDGAKFTKMEDDNGRSSSISYNEINATHNNKIYDYKYREYLSSGTTYYLKTNSDYGDYISIYITK